MITLRELAAWEDRLDRLRRDAVAAQPPDALDAHDRALEQRGIYAEYAAVFRSYVDTAELADDESAALEALKRATLLLWLAGVLPAPATGIAELPELAVRTVRRRLEERARHGTLDDELLWMLPWYHAVSDFALVGQEALPHLEALVVDADAQGWRRRARREALPERGWLGRYWLQQLG